jgi:hypothetical protein
MPKPTLALSSPITLVTMTVDYALQHGWGRPVPTETCEWTEIPRLAVDYAAGRIASYYPIFRVSAQAG